MSMRMEHAIYLPHIKANRSMLTTPDSKVKVIVVPTNEELVIARDTVAIVTGKMK